MDNLRLGSARDVHVLLFAKNIVLHKLCFLFAYCITAKHILMNLIYWSQDLFNLILQI